MGFIHQKKPIMKQGGVLQSYFKQSKWVLIVCVWGASVPRFWVCMCISLSELCVYASIGKSFCKRITSICFFVNRQMTNFQLHNEQTVIGLKNIARGFVFCLKWQHIYIYMYIYERQWWASYCLKVTELHYFRYRWKNLATFNPLPIFPSNGSVTVTSYWYFKCNESFTSYYKM